MTARKNPLDFSTLIRAARVGITQRQAAESVSPLLSVRTLEDWEAGRRAPPPWAWVFILGKIRRKAAACRRKGLK